MLTFRRHFYFLRRNVEDYRKAIGYSIVQSNSNPNYGLAYAERSEAWTFIGDLSRPSKGTVSAASEKGCGEGCRNGSESRRGACGLGWTRFFVRLEVCRRLKRIKARKELSSGKSYANDLLAPSDHLSGTNRRGRTARPTSCGTRSFIYYSAR